MNSEFFGLNEKVWSDQEWLETAKVMKNSSYTRARYLRMIAEAEHQSARFSRIGYASGILFFLVFMKFPVIRIQPGFRRLYLSAGLSYPIYLYVDSIGAEMKVKRIKNAYRKQVVDQHCHHRITI